MGRLLKKKDPDKKKAQRNGKTDSAPNESKNETVESTKAVAALKKAVEPVKPKSITGEPNLVQKSIQFLREVKIELKKVTWPSRKQTIGSTVVVLVIVMIVSFYLGIVDFILAKLMRAVLPS
jgi:preprotein translocase subunit SecE